MAIQRQPIFIKELLGQGIKNNALSLGIPTQGTKRFRTKVLLRGEGGLQFLFVLYLYLCSGGGGEGR